MVETMRAVQITNVPETNQGGHLYRMLEAPSRSITPGHGLKTANDLLKGDFVPRVLVGIPRCECECALDGTIPAIPIEVMPDGDTPLCGATLSVPP